MSSSPKDIVGFCEDCGEKSPADIHTCSPFEDKNGHRIDPEGKLVFDERCRGCDSPEPLEDILRKVIEVQVKGGYDRYDPFLNRNRAIHVGEKTLYVTTEPSEIGFGHSSAHVLKILLDTEGAKAAFGSIYFRTCCKKILNAWHSAPGNNVRAALETAVSFLPKR